MKVLKYILLLLVLVFIAAAIFIATLKPDYDIVRTKTINAPKTTVFNYINDYKNWEEFGSWKQDDPKMKFIYPKNTIGKGSYYSWKGQDGEGKIKTIAVKNNDSIHQKMNLNGADSDVYWTFNEVNGKTKVSWRSIGKMDFVNKIFSNLLGGLDKLIGNMYERSLVNIDKNLTSQVNSFAITVDGFQEKTIGFYLQKTINSKNENLESNILIMIPQILKFISDNKIQSTGKPFVKYNSVNDSTAITNFSVAVPIKDSIQTSSQSEHTFANMLPFQSMKVTLNGDLIHKKKAISKLNAAMLLNNLVPKIDLPTIEVYKINKSDFKNPSKWITEIYIPVRLKSAVRKVYKPKNTNIPAISSPSTSNNSVPSSENP